MALRQSDRVTTSVLPAVAKEFLAAMGSVVVAGEGRDGRIWTTLLAGEPGFLDPLDDSSVAVHASPPPDDPLSGAFVEGSRVGLLAIHLATQQRMKIKGRLRRAAAMEVEIERVYALCRNYITPREWQPEVRSGDHRPPAVIEDRLDERAQALVDQADTFFIGTVHDDSGPDAAHRGGRAGVLQRIDDRTLRFPDYRGNGMFNTLGNLAVDPRAGLLVVDFAGGDVVQVSGRAAVLWDDAGETPGPGDLGGEVVAARPIQRTVELSVESVVLRPRLLQTR